MSSSVPPYLSTTLLIANSLVYNIHYTRRFAYLRVRGLSLLFEALLDECVDMSLLELGVLALDIFDQLLLRQLSSMTERNDIRNHIIDA